MITLSLAKEVFDFDPKSGALFWRRGSRRAAVGSRAGYVHRGTGYRLIKVDGIRLREHHVVWLMFHGEWPMGEIDHRNRCRDDNSPGNLRMASVAQNRANASLRHDNQTGYRGVYLHKQSGRYHAELRVNGVKRSLGLYGTAEEAGEAARLARIAAYGQFAPSYDSI